MSSPDVHHVPWSDIHDRTNDLSLLTALSYYLFAVEGCLQLIALEQSVEDNRASARTYARDALHAIVRRYPPFCVPLYLMSCS